MTPDQRKMARHALGLDGERKRSYRNRYFTSAGTLSEDEWNDLCRRGLARREAGAGKMVHFYLTDEGAAEALDPGEILDPEDFCSPQETASD